MTDYTVDWSHTNIDGNNTATSGGGGTVGFSVATPENADRDQWIKAPVGGYDGLKAYFVEGPTSVKINFDSDVQNISFEIFDVDSSGLTWDDRVTVIAKDADGNIIPVNFSDLASHHQVSGNVLDSDGYVNAGVDGSGEADSVTVTIAGPIASLEVIYDNGTGADSSGTIGLSDIHFDLAATEDGYVDGTSGNDLIDVAYAGDPDGDKIDNNDAILPGEGADDDIVLAGAGNDTVKSGNGNDEVYGGDGDDTLSGGSGNDTVYGGDGSDTMIANAGDIVDGGATGSDHDVLDLTGQGPFYLEDVVSDETTGGNGNGINGTVIFVDGDGNPTGETLTFTDIEEIIGEEVNRGPIAQDDTATVDEDGSVDITVLGNDSDPDGDDLTVTYATSPDGDVTINADGTLTFEPNDNFNGDTTITYTIGDGNGATATATVNVYVTPVNDGPVAVADDFDAGEDDAAGEIGNVLTNDDDPDGDTLTVGAVNGDDTLVGTPVAGSDGGLITINADGSTTFDPNGDFEALGEGETATTTVTYTVTDPSGAEATETVTITVTGTNDAPEAVLDTDTTDQTTVTTLDNVLGNDVDPEGDTLVVGEVNGDDTLVGTAVAGDNGGTFTINADGSTSFDPNSDFDDLAEGDTAVTEVSYTVVDGNGGTNTTTVTVTVTGTNDGPVAGADVDETDQNTAIVLDNVLGNDTDADGDTLTVGAVNGDDTLVGTAVAGDNGGLVTINADGSTAFDPNGEFDGLATGETATTAVSYTVTDPSGATDTTTVTVTVTGTNDAPTAVNDADVTDFNQAVVVDLLDNDFDVDGDDLTVIEATVPAAEGTIEDNGDGTWTFTPALGFTGTATISYTIEDEEGLTSSAEHTVDVGDAPLDGTVEGTDGSDIIDGGYLGDPDGDRVDNDDAILSGGVGDDDLIYGFGCDDTILAGAGDDEVYGGEGNDFILGQGGFDTLFGDDGDDTITGGKDDDTIFGGADDDVLDGDSGNDSIEGNAGDDTVFGGAGNDTIATADGNDVVEGGDGNDIIDTGNDQLDALPDVGYPGVYPADLDPYDDLDTVFGGAGNDSISTGDDDDVIFGGTGNDVIDAGFDDDYVEGGEGDDTIIGSEGNDEVYGGDGNDTIFGGLVTPGPADALNLPDDIDLVDDNNNDTLFGGDGNDTIYGADDDDTLYGDAGDDTLIGGVDEDEQYGGTGNDTFIINKVGHGAGDVIVGGEDPDGNDIDVLDLTGAGVGTITHVDGDPEAGTVTFLDGSTMTFSEIEHVIPCFTPGTTIATPKGERLVEELREGDRIITRDNGNQEIRWVGRKKMSGKALVANPHLKPILVRAGSLGNGLPERDMLVSPNHRMLVASEKTQLYFEEREVLAAAKHLVGSEGIHAVDVMGTSYIHFMFDRHEVVLSNGAWTESFQPGDYSLKGIGNAQRNEIFELFPELQNKVGLEGYQSARRALKKHEAKLLVK